MAFYKCARIYVTENSNTEINTASGPIANFNTSLVLPLIDVKAEIKALETGTGAKSPSNPYVISGFTGANIKHTGGNMYDANTATIVGSRLLNYETGNLSAWGLGWSALETYVEIPSNAQLQLYSATAFVAGGNAGVCFYDRNKTFISGLQYKSGFIGNTLSFTTPANAKYMRWCGLVDSMTDSCLSPNATAYKPYTANVYPVSWQTEAGEVFGGYYDFTTGKLVVTHKGVDMGGLSWTYSSSAFKASLSDGKMTNATAGQRTSLCEIYNLATAGGSMQNLDYIIGSTYWSTSCLVVVKDSDYTDATLFTNAVRGKKLVYELATPVEYDLTPQQISALLGVNNIWSDTNGDTTVKYRNLAQGG